MTTRLLFSAALAFGCVSARAETPSEILNRAKTELRQGHAEEGREMLLELSTSPDAAVRAVAYDEIARIDYEAGRYELAAKRWHLASELSEETSPIAFQVRYHEALALADAGRAKDASEALGRISQELLLGQEGVYREAYARLSERLVAETGQPIRKDNVSSEKIVRFAPGLSYGRLDYSDNRAAGLRFSSAALVVDASILLSRAWSAQVAGVIPLSALSSPLATPLQYLSVEGAFRRAFLSCCGLSVGGQFTTLLGANAAHTGFLSAPGPFAALDVRVELAVSTYFEGAVSQGVILNFSGVAFDFGNQRLAGKVGLYQKLGSLELGLGVSYTSLDFIISYRQQNAQYLGLFTTAKF